MDFTNGQVSRADVGKIIDHKNGAMSLVTEVSPVRKQEIDNDISTKMVRYTDVGGSVSYDREEKAIANTLYRRDSDLNPTRSNAKPFMDLPISGHNAHDVYRKQIGLAQEMYLWEPIVATVIDIMVEFSIAGWHHQCNNPRLKKWYDDWAEDVKLGQVIKWAFQDYYMSGSARIMHEDDARGVPLAFDVINPAVVRIEGSLNTALTGKQPQYAIKKSDLTSDSYIDRTSELQWPSWAKELEDMIIIPSDKMFSVERKKMPYQRYPTPLVMRVARAIMFKRKLELMDWSTADNMINSLVTVTIGNDEYPAKEKHLKKLQQVFQTGAKAMIVYWDHTLDVKFHRPEADQVLGSEKYERVIADIMTGLGVSDALVSGGGGGAYASQWIAVLALIERLEWGRQDIIQAFKPIYRQMQRGRGQYAADPPELKFDRMRLRQEDRVKMILMAMRDRGLLSARTALEEAGYDADTEMKNQREEMELMMEGIFTPIGNTPIQGEPGRPAGRPGVYPDMRQPNNSEPNQQAESSVFMANGTVVVPCAQDVIDAEIETSITEVDQEIENIKAAAKQMEIQQQSLLHQSPDDDAVQGDE
jgi:hypothetical protein